MVRRGRPLDPHPRRQHSLASAGGSTATPGLLGLQAKASYGTFFVRLHEVLGESLLEARRSRESVVAYERALELTPNRSASLLGLARARRALGDRAGSASAYQQLLANWKNADGDLTPLRELLAEARAGAAR